MLDQARTWIDLACSADDGDDVPLPGLLAAHFHASDDGTHMLNYAEWVDPAAHRRMVEAPADDAVADQSEPEPLPIRSFSGIAETAVDRFEICVDRQR